MTNSLIEKQSLLDDLIKRAKAAGADQCDAILVGGTSTSVGMRCGQLEELERSEGTDLGLRVFVGQQQAMVSASDIRPTEFDMLVNRAIDMAKNSPAEPYATLAEPEMLSDQRGDDLNIWDAQEPDVEILKDIALRAEEAALNVNGVTNSDGGNAGFSHASIALATSNGFVGGYNSSSFSISVSAVAGEGVHMERDYDYSAKHHFDDLSDAETIGRMAGERAVKRLNPKKVASGQYPIIYDPRVGNSLVGHFADAIHGASIARKSSFLQNHMNQQVFAEGINIVDDPHVVKGLKSKPFDAEGLQNDRLDLVEGGVLKHWFLNLSTAKQLGLTSNGRATRGTSSPPGIGSTNLYIAAGTISRDDMIKDIKSGLYLTELVGMGVNGITGDYSRGAAGFWIEDGEIAYPVSEITIAGNLKDMFLNMTAADDLDFKYGTNAPTLRLDGMTIAGL